MSSADGLVSPLPVTDDLLPGVNLTGFLDGHTGLGEVARKLERVLEHTGVPFVFIPYRQAPHARRQPLRHETSPYDTNVICLNADYLHTFLEDVTAKFFANRFSIGVWFWETSIFRPENSEGFRFLDEVWVASEYVRSSMAAQAEIPVVVAPLPIDRPPASARGKGELGLPEAFTFLFNFDCVSFERKNPTAVAQAFIRAFDVDDGACLVLKTINGARKPRQLAELRASVEDRPDVFVVDTYLPAAQKNDLVAACDCYVSLHRSEGFGLTIAEAMSHGKPVIATGYSGNLEFTTEDNSHLVPYRLTRIPPDWWAYSAGAEWAEPDVEVASAVMRRVFENPDEARVLGERGREDILARFSIERAAEFVGGRLRDARQRGAVGARTSAHDARPPILEASQELAKEVGESLAEGGASPPTSLARRLLRRALWPHLEDQRRYETSVLDALTTLQRSVQGLEQRIVQLEAQVGRVSEGAAEPTAASDSSVKKSQTSRA